MISALPVASSYLKRLFFGRTLEVPVPQVSHANETLQTQRLDPQNHEVNAGSSTAT